MEHKVQVVYPEQPAEKFKSFTERFGKCTIPAILELVKQQGETTNNAATELGVLYNIVCIFIILFKDMHYKLYRKAGRSTKVYFEEFKMWEKGRSVWNDEVNYVYVWGKNF